MEKIPLCLTFSSKVWDSMDNDSYDNADDNDKLSLLFVMSLIMIQ